MTGVEDDEDEQQVVFRVDDEEYCINVDAVQEIIRIPKQSHSASARRSVFVEGLVNLRGTVLPVIDLRARLGLPRSERDDLQRIVVVIIKGVLNRVHRRLGRRGDQTAGDRRTGGARSSPTSRRG